MPKFGVSIVAYYRIPNIKFVKLAGYKNITVKIRRQGILMVNRSKLNMPIMIANRIIMNARRSST